MKLLLVSLVVVAYMAHSACGFGRLSFSSVRIDTKRLMYAAGGSVQCDLCEMVVGDIQSLLKGHESEIENFLDSLCAVLPKEFQANCTNLVNTYLPILFSLIDDMTPEEVCELFTLCPGETEVLEVTGGMESLGAVFNHYMSRLSRWEALKERRVNYIRSLVKENYLCEACEETVGFVHDAIANNQSLIEVVRFLMPLCEFCPSRHRAQCQKFVVELPGDISEFADEYLDPVRDCQILGFCPKEPSTPTSTVYKSTTGLPGTTTEVYDATTVFEEPTTKVEDPTTFVTRAEEPEIEVPIQIAIQPRAHRIGVIDKRIYGMSRLSKKNMKKLAKAGKHKKRKPRFIFVEVEDEDNQIPYDVYGSESYPYETVPDHTKCEICRYFSSAADGVLLYNKADITDGLTIIFEDICNALPDQFKDECTSSVTDVLPDVIYQLVLKLMNPDYLCTQLIGICQ